MKILAVQNLFFVNSYFIVSHSQMLYNPRVDLCLKDGGKKYDFLFVVKVLVNLIIFK